MPPKPDSLRGWAVAAAAFIATSVLLGLSYSFGVLMDPMAAELDASQGGTAIAFSVTVALPFLAAPVTGRLADRYGPRPLLGAATLLSAVGLVACAHSTSAWAFELSYGLGVGGGAACAFVPMVAAVGGWFERRRALALAVALAGTGAGTMVAAPLIASLVEAHGLRTTCLVLAAVVLVAVPVAAALAATPPAHAAAAPAPVRGSGFRRLYVAGSAGALSAFIPFAFVVPAAIEHGVSSRDAALVLATAGAANVAGRVTIPVAASRLGLLEAYRATFFVLAAGAGVWLAAGGVLPALVAFACLFGAGYGAFVALSPAVAAELLGTTALGRRLGTLYTSAGIGAVTGPALAGALIEATDAYEPAIALTALAAVSGALALGRPWPGLCGATAPAATMAPN